MRVSRGNLISWMLMVMVLVWWFASHEESQEIPGSGGLVPGSEVEAEGSALDIDPSPFIAQSGGTTPIFCFKEVFGNQPWTTPVQVISLSSAEKKRPHFELDPDLPTLQPDENGFVFAADLESALAGSDLAAAAISEFLFLPVGAFPTPCPAPPDSPQVTRDVPVVPFASLSGRVVDKRGQPFAGALVDIVTDRRSLSQFLQEKNIPGLIAAPVKVKTASDGRFSTSGLFPGRVTTVGVRHADALDLEETLTLAVGENDVDLVMAASCSIRIAFSDAGFPADSEEQIYVDLHRFGKKKATPGFTPYDYVGWTLVKPGDAHIFGPLEAGCYEIGYRSRKEGEPIGFFGVFVVDSLAGGEQRDLGTVDVLAGRAVEVCVLDDHSSEPMAGVTVEFRGWSSQTLVGPDVDLVTDATGCVMVFGRIPFDPAHYFRVRLDKPPDTRHVGPPSVQINKGDLTRHEFRLEPWVIRKRTVEIIGPPEIHDPGFLALLENEDTPGHHAAVKTYGLASDGSLHRAGPNLAFPGPNHIRWEGDFDEWIDTLVVALNFTPHVDLPFTPQSRTYWGVTRNDRQAETLQLELQEGGRLVGKIVRPDGSPILTAGYSILNYRDGQELSEKLAAGEDVRMLEDKIVVPSSTHISGTIHRGMVDITYVPPLGHLDLWIQCFSESVRGQRTKFQYIRAGTFRDLGSRTLDLGTIVVGE